MADRVNRKEYHQSLPKKRISAGCLFFDRSRRLLIVKPTYKEGWEIPGGSVNANASPLLACVREGGEGKTPWPAGPLLPPVGLKSGAVRLPALTSSGSS